jgi:hypothetical protein
MACRQHEERFFDLLQNQSHHNLLAAAFEHS